MAHQPREMSVGVGYLTLNKMKEIVDQNSPADVYHSIYDKCNWFKHPENFTPTMASLTVAKSIFISSVLGGVFYGTT
jgi:hypothetical protein